MIELLSVLRGFTTILRVVNKIRDNFSPFLFSTMLIEYDVIVPKFTEIVQNPGIPTVGIPYRTIAGYTDSLG
jgi:hypothetical protein